MTVTTTARTLAVKHGEQCGEFFAEGVRQTPLPEADYVCLIHAHETAHRHSFLEGFLAAVKVLQGRADLDPVVGLDEADDFDNRLHGLIAEAVESAGQNWPRSAKNEVLPNGE